MVKGMIMLLPLGVYLKVLFNKKHIKEAAAIVRLASAAIEAYQLVFSSAWFFPGLSMWMTF
jgi:glycopeptide antibiotics resistance protein